MADYTYGIGQELQFNTQDTDLTHTWDFGDGTPISSDPSPTHIYATQGTYIVTHGARDFCGACLSASHTVEIVTSSITVRSILLDKYTANVGDIVTVTVIAQNLGLVFGTGSIVVKFDNNVVGTFGVTLDPGQEVSFDVPRQVTTSGTIHICADNICTALFVEYKISVKSITLDTNTSTGNPIMATIEVENTGSFTGDKSIQTTLTNTATLIIDDRVATVPPGTMTYQVPVTVIGLSNGTYTLCAETICKAILVAVPTEVNGRLGISSTPQNAEIFIDGQSTSKFTDATVTGISPGSHTFTLKLTGYNDTTGSFDITAGMTTYVYSALSTVDPITGSISISSSPPGAEIWINNVQQLDTNNQPLTTPATVTGLSSPSPPSPPTSYGITLKLSGYIDYNKTIDIIAGQTTYMDTVLMQSPILIGSINFTTTPDGASIFIDGQEKVGKFTPVTITSISIGSHTFTLKYPGRNDAIGTIYVIGGITSYVYVDMSIVSPTVGSISISSIPQNADIYLDGTLYLLKTPTTIGGLIPRTYTIVLKKTGYADYTTTINAIAGQTVSINITLVPTVVMAGLEFPWWLLLGIAAGMYQVGKTKEEREIREKQSTLPGARRQNFGHGPKVITLTKKDYTIR